MQIVIFLLIWLSSNVLSSCKLRDDSDLKELPESPMVDMFDEDSHYYKNLQAKFGSSGLNFTVNKDSLILNSPLEGGINLLSRFGTPTIAKLRLMDDGDPVGIGYFHDALDIARKDPESSNQVLAPVSGKAKLVFDEDPDEEKPMDLDGYSTSIVIHDLQSNALIGLLHVKPLPKFYKSEGFIDVAKGEVIGQIANIESSIIQDSPELRHVHLMIIDFEKRQFINPSLYSRGYKDTLNPTIGDLAFYDEQRKRHSKLISGKLDLVVPSFDRDDFSTFNQEIAQMSVHVSDQDGKEIFRLPPCNFENFWFQKDLRSKTPLHALNIQPIFDPLPIEGANIVRENIVFEYAATNLKVFNQNCEIIEDAMGYFSVDDSVQSVTVNVTVSDHFGNQSNKKFEITR